MKRWLSDDEVNAQQCDAVKCTVDQTVKGAKCGQDGSALESVGKRPVRKGAWSRLPRRNAAGSFMVGRRRTIRQVHKDGKHFQILVNFQNAGMAPVMRFNMS